MSKIEDSSRSLNELTDFRRSVRAQIKKRGHRTFDVWSGYASKGGKPFAMDGTPNTLHLIWMEADPEVLEYTIPTERVIAESDDGYRGTVPDAICTMRSGRCEWREVKTAQEAQELAVHHSDQILAQTRAAEKYGVQWRLITTNELDKHRCLIINWRKGLAYLWAASQWDLQPHMYSILQTLPPLAVRTVGQVLECFTAQEEPLAVAALFRLAQLAKIELHLDKSPLSLATTIRRWPE